MFTKPYSEDTAKVIDEEVSKMIEFQYTRAIQILIEHKDKLEQLANKLLTAEVIFKEDLENIFGKRIWDKEEVLSDASEVIVDKNDDQVADTTESIENLNSNDNSSTESTNSDGENTDTEVKE
jgi:cell division protease FtsH